MTGSPEALPLVSASVDATCCITCGLRKSQRLTAEDVFLIVIVIASLAAAVALALPFKAPPTVIATFLAIAVSTLVYRFLGGIPKATHVVVKTVQISGTLAALITLYLLFNSHLTKEQQVDIAFKGEEVEGTWEQAYPEGGWRGTYRLDSDPMLPAGSFRVSGELKQIQSDRTVVLLRVTSGSVATATQNGLTFKLRLKGEEPSSPWRGKTLTWETSTPLRRKRGTTGNMKVTIDGSADEQQWGIALMKVD